MLSHLLCKANDFHWGLNQFSAVANLILDLYRATHCRCTLQMKKVVRAHHVHCVVPFQNISLENIKIQNSLVELT